MTDWEQMGGIYMVTYDSICLTGAIEPELMTMYQARSFAKLSVPHCSRVFERKRLFLQMDAMLEHPVAWISGAAGAGKTALVLSYFQAKAITPLWFRIDAGDSDLASFFYYLALLAEQDAPAKGLLPRLTPEYEHGIAVFARNFIRDFYSRLPENTVLVFDNFQDIGGNHPLEPLLPILLGEIPSTIRIVIISRSSPAENLTRMLTTGDMQWLDGQPLEFTEDEIGGLIRLRNIEQLFDHNKIAALHHTTRGWAAGLILMLEQSADKALPLTTTEYTHYKIFHYFASEIFQHTSETVKAFLLKTAVLQQIDIPVAKQLTANSQAKAILLDMAQRNYFTFHCSGAIDSFHYHPLFREFLLAQAEQLFGRDKLNACRVQAAEILLRENNIDHAAELFRQARQWRRLCAVIENNAHTMIEKGLHNTLRHWIVSLPEPMQTRNHWLCYWRGITETSKTPRAAIAYFQQAYQSSKQERDALAQIASWCAAVNAYASAWSEVKTLDHWIEDLDSIVLLAREQGDPVIQAQVDYAVFLALMWRQPGHEKMPEYREKVWNIVMLGKDFETRVQAAGQLLFHLTWWCGEFEKAKMLVQTVQPLMNQQQTSPLVKITWHTMLGNYYATVFKQEECLGNIRKGVELSDKTGIYLWKSCLYDQLCYLNLHHGKTEQSTRYIERANETKALGGEFHDAMYHVLRAWYEIHTGDIHAAGENIGQAKKLASMVGAVMLEKIVDVCYASYLLKRGDHHQARELTRSIRQDPSTAHSNMLIFLSRIVDAEDCLINNNQKACVAALADLFGGARIYSAFWWRDQDFSKFCSLALQNGIEKDYVKEMIARHRLLPEPGYETDLWPYPVKIYTLGGFRLVVNNKEVVFNKKAPKKPLELIKALVAFGSQNVSDALIMEALWPGADGDAACNSLRTTVKRARQLLKEKQAILYSDGKLGLNPDYCWVDASCFDRICRHMHDDSTQLEKAYELYAGKFLANHSDQWLLSMRDRLHHQFVRATCLLAEGYEVADQCQQAIDIYLRALSIDELPEAFYQGLMRCYEKTGQVDQIETTYSQLCQLFDAKLHSRPSSETMKLYDMFIKESL